MRQAPSPVLTPCIHSPKASTDHSLTTYYSLLTTHYLLLTTHYLLLTTHYLLQAEATKALLVAAHGSQEAAAEAALSEQRHLLISAVNEVAEQRRAAAMAVANAAEARTEVADES